MKILQIATIIGTHLLLGRKASFPCAIFLGFPIPAVFVIIFLADLIQIPFYSFVLSKTSESISVLRRFQHRLESVRQDWANKNSFFNFLIKTGEFGVFAVAALPGAGGVQGGMVLAHILRIPNSKSMSIVGIASFIGCAIFTIGGFGLRKMVGV